MDLEGPRTPRPPSAPPPAAPPAVGPADRREPGVHRASGRGLAGIRASVLRRIGRTAFAPIAVGAALVGVDPRAPFSVRSDAPTTATPPRSTPVPDAVNTTRRRVAVNSETVAVEMENLVGHVATWVPSGPSSGNTFEQWVSATAEGSPPPLDDPATTINCWEMVLYAAYRSNAVDWSWLHELYRTDNVSRSWYDEIVDRIAPEGTQVYDAANPGGPQPQRGDVVFWNGCSHVGLALGTRDAMGRHEVFSFWPPPDFSDYGPGTTDRVKLTTIEELAEFMEGNYMGRPRVTFGRPAW